MTDLHPASYTSPSLERRYVPALRGFGVFACQAIRKGDLLCVWGGRIVDRAGLDELPPDMRQIAIQVEDELYLAPVEPLGEGEYVNHCCDPNAGLSGQIVLVAMRDIDPGEQVKFDYAMSDGSDYDEFDCECGAPGCRGKVTGSDWRLPELQERYKGYFSPYLQRRINSLSGQQSALD